MKPRTLAVLDAAMDFPLAAAVGFALGLSGAFLASRILAGRISLKSGKTLPEIAASGAGFREFVSMCVFFA